MYEKKNIQKNGKIRGWVVMVSIFQVSLCVSGFSGLDYGKYHIHAAI